MTRRLTIINVPRSELANAAGISPSFKRKKLPRVDHSTLQRIRESLYREFPEPYVNYACNNVREYGDQKAFHKTPYHYLRFILKLSSYVYRRLNCWGVEPQARRIIGNALVDPTLAPVATHDMSRRHGANGTTVTALIYASPNTQYEDRQKLAKRPDLIPLHWFDKVIDAFKLAWKHNPPIYEPGGAELIARMLNSVYVSGDNVKLETHEDPISHSIVFTETRAFALCKAQDTGKVLSHIRETVKHTSWSCSPGIIALDKKKT